jgi:hypothetical protein
LLPTERHAIAPVCRNARAKNALQHGDATSAIAGGKGRPMPTL